MSHSLQLANEMLSFYITAEKEVLTGKTITYNNRSWSRENLQEIRAGRQEWERKINQINAGGRSLPSLASFE